MNIDDIQLDAVVLVTGGDATIRTNCISSILSRKLNRGIRMTTYSESELRNLINTQMILSSTHPYNDNLRRSYLALENCLEDNTWIQNRLIRSIFSQNRTLGLLFIVSTDTAKARAITPIMRGKIDWIFIFAEPSREKRQHLYDRFIPDRYPFDAFCEYMDTYTKNDGCLVVDMLKDIITVPIDK